MAETKMVEYPFPIREGMTAYLWLPNDLKRAEIVRLWKMLASLQSDTLDRVGSTEERLTEEANDKAEADYYNDTLEQGPIHA